MVRRPGALWRFLRAKDAPLLPKLGLLFAAAYVIWPLDLIPDMAPFITWLDDVGVVALMAGWLSRAVTRYDLAAQAVVEE